MHKVSQGPPVPTAHPSRCTSLVPCKCSGAGTGFHGPDFKLEVGPSCEGYYTGREKLTGCDLTDMALQGALQGWEGEGRKIKGGKRRRGREFDGGDKKGTEMGDRKERQEGETGRRDRKERQTRGNSTLQRQASV